MRLSNLQKCVYLLSLLCLAVFSLACGPAPVDSCQGCSTLAHREDNLPPCDPESGCPEGGCHVHSFRGSS